MIGVCSTWTPLLQSAYHNFHDGITITATESHVSAPSMRTSRSAAAPRLRRAVPGWECEQREACCVCTPGKTRNSSEIRNPKPKQGEGSAVPLTTTARAPASSPKEFAAQVPVARATDQSRRGCYVKQENKDNAPPSHPVSSLQRDSEHVCLLTSLVRSRPIR